MVYANADVYASGMLFTRSHWLMLTFSSSLLLLLSRVTPSCCAGAGAAVHTDFGIENDVMHFSYATASLIDAEQRPCDNFYAYVCAKSLNSTQAQLDQRLQQEQKNFDTFLAADNSDQLMDVELKVKQFYESCKNARSPAELRGTLMYRQIGGWPAIDDSAAMLRKRRNNTWMEVLSTLHEVGQEYFFRHNIEIKSNKRVVLLQPDLSMRYTLRKIEQLAGEVLQTFNVVTERAHLVALEILSFERSRRDIIHKLQKTVNADKELEFTYEAFKSATVFGAASQIDWDAYFRKILGKPLKPTDTVIVKQHSELVQLFELVHNTSMTRLLNWIWIDYLMDKKSDDCKALVEHYFEPVYQHIVVRSAIDKVQMAQMYADIGRAYEELLPATPWIDEMSQQNSQQFLGRVIHLTLNGDAKLDTDYSTLTMTKRNFYRNLEKSQRFVTEQRKGQIRTTRLGSSSVAISQAATEYMSIFLTINSLLPQQQNLTTPLNYVLVGEKFADYMIAGGSSTTAAAAWRSMDSEQEFAVFERCLTRQMQTTGAPINFNLNFLIRRILAQHQTLNALNKWQDKHETLVAYLDNLLGTGRLHLTLRKLYFVGTLLADCRHYADMEQKEFVHSYLRNSPEFTQAFGCRAGDKLYARNVCNILP